MNSEIKKILNIFEDKIPEYFDHKKPVRSSQVQMALDITEFLYSSSKNIMFIEAPVGTGKSLGVLAPSIMNATKYYKTINYATSTINLQNQIFEADSVLLEKIGLIDHDQKIFALGKSNYLCTTAFKCNEKKFTIKEKEQLKSFFSQCKYGFVSEFKQIYPKFNDNKIKNFLLMNSIEEQCYISCPGHSHRFKYLSTHNKLVITNHDQQIQTYLNTSNKQNPIIPNNPGIIVFDEAHSLKENFLGRSEISLNYGSLTKLKINRRLTEYKLLLQQLNFIKKEYVKSPQQSNMRYKIEEKDLIIIKSIKDIIEDNMIEKMQSKSRNDYSNKNDELETILNHLEEFLNESKNTSWIQFGKNIEMHYISNHFNSAFKKFIIDLSRKNKIIFMSGTLTSEEHSKEFKINWGLNKGQYIYKKYPNVFNLNKQMLVYIPKKVPHPTKCPEEHLSEIINELPDILNISSGGSLILCTSNEHVTEISLALKNKLPSKINLYTQGEKNASILSDKFKKDVSSILVGSGSFFSGFSVEGKSLDKVFITKLPYPVPTDPYIKLISSGYDNKDIFDLFIKPMMFKKLEQGLGRLIRSITDYGIATIFDSRIWDDLSIQNFFEAHNYKLTSKEDDIVNFMKNTLTDVTETEFQEYNRSYLTIPSFELSTAKENSYNEKKIILAAFRDSNKIDLSEWLKQFVEKNKTKNNNKNYRISYKKLEYPIGYYQEAINFCYTKGLPLSLVKDHFPYSSDNQKNKFLRISPTTSAPVEIKQISDLNKIIISN